MKFLRGRRRLSVALLLWLGAIGAGMAVLISYSHTPGTAGAPLEQWPDQVEISRGSGATSLVLFLHPQCPCSRATVNELARMVSKSGRPVEVTVCFLHLPQWNDSAGESSLWRAAARIPGVRTIADANGRLARRFGAETSGTAALYDKDGRLVFFGGITAARGEEGDNAAEEALQRLISGTGTGCVRSPVYGCSIF